ncbi:hypothetical protein KY289_020005 [Solanum tuberosum]|nr:hypothetical protein KY289_020005 [Solanum tuberosum]
MRTFKPTTPSKGENLPKAKMAKLFIHPSLSPTKAEIHQRPEMPFHNKFTAIADYPRPSCPPPPKLINLRPTKPFEKGASSSSSIQTKKATQ